MLSMARGLIWVNSTLCSFEAKLTYLPGLSQITPLLWAFLIRLQKQLACLFSKLVHYPQAIGKQCSNNLYIIFMLHYSNTEMKASTCSVHTMCQPHFTFSTQHHQCSQELYDAGINIPIIQIRKLKLRDVKCLAPNQTAGKDMNSGLHVSRVLFNMSFLYQVQIILLYYSMYSWHIILKTVNFFAVHSLV